MLDAGMGREHNENQKRRSLACQRKVRKWDVIGFGYSTSEANAGNRRFWLNFNPGVAGGNTYRVVAHDGSGRQEDMRTAMTVYELSQDVCDHKRDITSLNQTARANTLCATAANMATGIMNRSRWGIYSLTLCAWSSVPSCRQSASTCSIAEGMKPRTVLPENLVST